MSLKPVEKTIFGLLDKIPIEADPSPVYKKQVVGETSLQNIPKRFGNGTGFLRWFTSFLQKSEIGKYPKEYNPRVHGPYYPHRYYRTADPLKEVKLGEVPNWFARRDKSVLGTTRALSRAFWTWNHYYFQARRPGTAPLYQAICASMLYFFICKYKSNQNERHSKYH